MVYYLFNALRYRSLTFFSACNPDLSFGGMLDDNKTEAYNFIPDRYLPKMIVYDFNKILQSQLETKNIQFPVIIKPNMGFKGYAVKECKDLRELENIVAGLDKSKEWLIQEYIDLESEFSIMYYCFPDSQKKGITSISSKRYPTLIGDGFSTIQTLINEYKNPFVNKSYLKEKWASRLKEIPSKDQMIELHHIGNYSRGSKFYSLMNEKDERLISAMNNVFSNEVGIYFTRLDIKAHSLEHVRRGDFKIMEINGAKSEPLHIYDPMYGFVQRIKDVRKHWKIMTRIVDEIKRKGYRFPSNIEGLKSVQAAKRGVR